MIRRLLLATDNENQLNPAVGSPLKKLASFILFLSMILSLPEQASAGKGVLPPAPPVKGKSLFFASPGACASSGQFSALECAAAFERVAALIRERAPKFADKYECVLRFKLCEAGPTGYFPAAVGVEMILSSKGLVTLPMLAVETPPDMLQEPEAAPSPYGALVVETVNRPPPTPRSMKSYRRFIEDSQLRQIVLKGGASANSQMQAER